MKTILIYIFLLSLGFVTAEGTTNNLNINKAAIFGVIKDGQNQPVPDALVELTSGQANFATHSQADGSFALAIDPNRLEPKQSNTLKISRAHFETLEVNLDSSQLAMLVLKNPASLSLGELSLSRHISAGFWIAALIFVLVLVFIATGWLHNTLAALVGASLAFLFSYLGSLIIPDLYIFRFPRALTYIDWNVIFLIMGMMIVIAIVEHTGIFQWLAFAAYRASKGKMFVLMAILVLIASIGSAVLDNVTTMLLMTPIVVRIALTLKINPLALLMPAIFASNIAGVSTLVGTPTNILIGSYAGISFNDFLVNQTLGVVLALLGLIIYGQVIFRKELRAAAKASPKILAMLEQSAKITQAENLKKSGWVGLGMLILFVVGESIHLNPAVIALMGSTALLVWIRPNIEEMIKAVDWTTLVFFMMLFVVVGAIQEVGLIAQIATLLANIVGENLLLAMLVVIWSSALLSTVIANIPFTAAMLPVIAYLTATIPGADTKVLFYCLSVGAAMGGNGSLIGASANMVAAGISERAGYPISYAYFLKKGMPILFISVGIATIWLLLRFMVFGA